MIKSANLVGSVSRNAGGLFESVRRLVQSLMAEGMEIRVFTSEDEHTVADIGQWAPVPVKAFRVVGPRQFGYSPEFREALEAFAPDLTHTHGLWMFPSIATSQYCCRKRSPYVISAHGMLDPWAIRHSRWKKVIAHFLYKEAHLREANCLRALCENEARSIRQLGLKNPIAIIPNGIDLPSEAASKEQGARSEEGGSQKSVLSSQKAEAGNPPSAICHLPSTQRKTLLYLGRIHPKKGLMNLLRAWKQTLNSQPSTLNSWILAIAGWDQGGHEAELKRLATELGIVWQDVREHPTFNIQHSTSNQSEVGSRKSEVSGQSSVVFLGPQFGDAKSACYRNCDAFILPSFSEGVPMVVLEAWAYRKPVLMTPECNLPAGFARGAAMRIETNVESISQGLRELFQAPSSRLQALGASGHQLVCEQFAWPVLGREMAGLYRWILGGGDKPACITDF